MNNPLISICIPVYNVEKYLRECLDGIVNQTLCNIEIICVNDDSTDCSLDILESYKVKDSRIKLISFETNKSLLQARKAAVEVATAPFIMFVDSDDSLELDACEKLYAYINKYNVDILHFGTFVDATSEVRSDVIKWFENFAEPYQQVVYGDDILICCFKDRKIIWNLCNKIYRTDIVKKAYSNIGILYLNMCEDMYAFFLISYYAESYLGIEEKFYHYRFGAGMTGKRIVYDDKNFSDLCNMARIVPLLEKVICPKDKSEIYADIFKIINNDFLNGALCGLCNLGGEVNKFKSLELYSEMFGKEIAYEHIVARLNEQEQNIQKLNILLKEHMQEINRLNDYICTIQNTRGYKLLELARKIKRKLLD